MRYSSITVPASDASFTPHLLLKKAVPFPSNRRILTYHPFSSRIGQSISTMPARSAVRADFSLSALHR